METEAIAKSVRQPTHGELRFGVATADASHVRRALRRAYQIHAQVFLLRA